MAPPMPVRVASVDDYFTPRTIAGAQPGIKAALAGKEALHRAQLMVAKFFYDAGFVFNAAHSPYYQASYSAAAAIGPGFVVPSYHALRTHLLADYNMFWGYCLEIVKVVTPIMKLLRFVDSDEKPSLGYVYKGMTLIIEGIKNIYPDNESKYKPFIDIVEKRFDKHFRGDMHRAAYYFNPALAYNHTTTLIEFVKSAILNLFELKTYCTDDMAAVKELKIYEETKGSFGQELAIRGRSVLHPDHYNTKKLNTDPFDSEWISSTDFWVLDDQGSTPTPELNYEELMAALDEEMGRTTIGADEGTSRKRRRTE
ncbi:hypothetical protein LINPERHAP1_LOCUS19161, partial [Linum perenne]